MTSMNRRSFVKASLTLSAAPALTSSLAAPSLAQSGGAKVLKFVPQTALTILDPSFTAAAVTSQHGYHVFDTLYGLDSNLKVRPQMAAGHEVSEDGLTWVITLRDGLRFHDGEPVRARDCVASIRRWMARDVFAKDFAKTMDAVEAPEDRKLRIKLKRPFPLLPLAFAKIAPTVLFIMPERLANIEPSRQISEIIGSGPYRFVADELVVGSRVVYQKFDKYVPREEAAEGTSGGKVAYFDRIEWAVMPDASTAAAALQAGEIDWWDQVHPDLAPLLKGNKDIEVRRLDPYGFIPYMRFNSTIAPFNNPALRNALTGIVDQQDYMASITGGDASMYTECHSFFPCGTPYGRPSVTDPLAKVDFEAVKQRLKAAGYNGEKVVIVNPADFPTLAPLGQITHELLKKVGMNVEIVETDWGSVLARVQSREIVEKGGWNIYHSWWGGLNVIYPPTNAALRGLGKSGWTGWYESAEMEALNSGWLDSSSDADRLTIASQMQALAFRDTPSIPLGQFYMDTAYRRSLTGIIGPRPVPWNVRRV